MNYNPSQKEIDFVNASLALFNDEKVGTDNHELLNIVECDFGLAWRHLLGVDAYRYSLG